VMIKHISANFHVLKVIVKIASAKGIGLFGSQYGARNWPFHRRPNLLSIGIQRLNLEGFWLYHGRRADRASIFHSQLFSKIAQ